jgi:hypothetical protein
LCQADPSSRSTLAGRGPREDLVSRQASALVGVFLTPAFDQIQQSMNDPLFPELIAGDFTSFRFAN